MARIEKNDGSYIIQSYFRHGKIIEIDDGNSTAKVQLKPEKEGEEGLILENVPIFFHCDDNAQLLPNGALEGASAAFRPDDNVVIAFSDNEQTAKIVANLTKKRPGIRFFCIVIDDYLYRFSYEVDEQTQEIVIRLKETIPFTPLAEGYVEHPLFDILGIDERYADHIKLRAFQYPFLFKNGQLLVYIAQYTDPFYDKTYLKIYFIDQSGQRGTLIWEDTLAWGKDIYDYAIGGEDGNIIYFAKYREKTNYVECDILKYNQTNLMWEHTRKYVPIIDPSEIFIGVNPDGTIAFAKPHNNDSRFLGTYYTYNINDGLLKDKIILNDDERGLIYKTPFDWYKSDSTKNSRGYVFLAIAQTAYINTYNGETSFGHFGDVDFGCPEHCPDDTYGCGHDFNYTREEESKIILNDIFLNIYQISSSNLNILDYDLYEMDTCAVSGSCFDEGTSCYCSLETASGFYVWDEKFFDNHVFPLPYPTPDNWSLWFALQPQFVSLPVIFWYFHANHRYREHVYFTAGSTEWPCAATDGYKMTEIYTSIYSFIDGQTVFALEKNALDLVEWFLTNNCAPDKHSLDVCTCTWIDYCDYSIEDLEESYPCCNITRQFTYGDISYHYPIISGGIWTSAAQGVDSVMFLNKDGTFNIWIKDRKNDILEDVTTQIMNGLGVTGEGVPFLNNVFIFWER